MREQCLRFLEQRIELLAARISLSERITGPVGGLEELLSEGERRFPVLGAQLLELNPEEPYRRAFIFVRERIRATRRGDDDGYREPAELLAELRTVERSLLAGPGALTAAEDLRDVLRQVKVFGFHFARLHIREHARRHREALADVLEGLGVQQGYAVLPDAERSELLCRLIDDRRPLIPADLSPFSDDTQTVIVAFRTVSELLRGRHPGAIESYIVSGTEGPADLLEVLLLAKEAGLARPGGEHAALRIVPLFEAAQTLRDAPQTMDALLSQPVYRAALRSVGDEQEVMVGYSDSNKDADYVASGWATYRAQHEVADVLRAHGASWLFRRTWRSWRSRRAAWAPA